MKLEHIRKRNQDVIDRGYILHHEGGNAHQDRAYLLKLVEKLQSMLADITDCSCETCIKKEHCVFFELYVLYKLESEGGE